MVTDLKLLRLLQLVSPGLPIGMYSYSQGMESAVADGWISKSEETQEWLAGILKTSFAHIDLPILDRLYSTWENGDLDKVAYWCQTLMAYRETGELRLEDRHSGQALARLLSSLGFAEMQSWSRHPEATLAGMFSFVAVQWQIPKHQMLIGYCWSWLENQVLCAVKLVPLGQVAGQQLLIALTETIPSLVEQALQIEDKDIGGSAFSLALASSRHEMQYSRLFRS
ncbi:MAG: urease accessory UreF family protein [Methyloglobulus sp.]